MRIDPPADQRTPLTETIACDLVIVGGGMAGIVCRDHRRTRRAARHADSGPPGLGRQRVQRGPAVDSGRDLAHGQQQPLVARGRRDRRNPRGEPVPQPRRQPADLRHDPARKSHQRAGDHAAAQHRHVRGPQIRSRYHRIRARLLQPEFDAVRRARAAVLRCVRRRHPRLL